VFSLGSLSTSSHANIQVTHGISYCIVICWKCKGCRRIQSFNSSNCPVLSGFLFLLYWNFCNFEKRKLSRIHVARELSGSPIASACKGPSLTNHRFSCYKLVGTEMLQTFSSILRIRIHKVFVRKKKNKRSKIAKKIYWQRQRRSGSIGVLRLRRWKSTRL